MNKKIIGFIIIIIVIVTVSIIVLLNNNSNKNNNNVLELEYQTNEGIPYKWEYEIEDESIVKFVKKYEVKNNKNKNIVGKPTNMKYVFKGLKEGETVITFKYVNITDKSASRKVRHKVKVDKDKNISLINK